jgi:hypothetical protein
MVLKRIHRWDRGVIFKSLIIGVTIEAIALVPAVLSTWGHAGPESWLGWLGVLLNLPGMLVVRPLRDFGVVGDSFAAIFTAVFIAQAVMLSYIVFVYLRRKKQKAEAP